MVNYKINNVDMVTAENAAKEIIASGLYNAAVALMDDEIRERLHREITPCTERKFLVDYIRAHYRKYNEIFTV